MNRHHLFQRGGSLGATLATVLLASCGADERETRIKAQILAVDPPQLWRAEALDDKGAVIQAIQICANRETSDGFSRGNAEVNGQACAPRKDAVTREGFYAVRCEVNGQPFGLTLNRRGGADDFTVRLAVQALAEADPAAISVRRYRREGACPIGWEVGDQGPAGSAQPTRNALTGVWDG